MRDKKGDSKVNQEAKSGGNNDTHKILNKLMKITELELKNKASNADPNHTPRK